MKNDTPAKAARVRADAERKAGYWQAFTCAVATRGATLAKATDRRGREYWECTVGRSTVQRPSAESAISGALLQEFDDDVPESFGLPASSLRPLVFSGTRVQPKSERVNPPEPDAGRTSEAG